MCDAGEGTRNSGLALGIQTWGLGGSVGRRLTLDVNSGHDLLVCGFESRDGVCGDSTEPAWFSATLNPCVSLSLPKQNKTNI